MPYHEHLAILLEGVHVWNEWREANPAVRPDLSSADLSYSNPTAATLRRIQEELPGELTVDDLPLPILSGAELGRVNLSEADLSNADLPGADLDAANLREANLTGAYLRQAKLRDANLTMADLSGADLRGAELHRAGLIRARLAGTNLRGANVYGARLAQANLSSADLVGADLRAAMLVGADLSGADLGRADLSGADLTKSNLTGSDMSEANLSEAILGRADLTEANLTGANLMEAHLVETIIEGARLSEAHVYGVSAWSLIGEPADEDNLVITPGNAPAVTVDDLEVAQFIYLMLHNEKLQRVIDTITSKVVLILGRFTHERKAVLDAVRAELRERHNYSPVVFDFDKPAGKTLTDTVRLLASMARFVIVDLSDATSANYELGVLSQLALRRTPFVIMAETGLPTMSMLDDVLVMQEVLDEVHRYDDLPHLKATLVEAVIEPAEARWRYLNQLGRGAS